MRTFDGFKRGIDLGGWLSQCGKNYNEEHYLNYILEKDIKEISSWGLDHVRLPIDYNVIQNEDGSFKAEGFMHVDRAVEWCKKYNLNVVLDIHKTRGYVFDDKNYCNFFYDEAAQKDFIDLWKEMSRRYGEDKNIVFELLNEVTSVEFAKPWNEIIAKTIPEIRKIAPTTRIIVGGIYNNSIYGLTLMDKPYDENVVFTFHCYSPFAFTHQKAPWIEKMPLDKACTFPLTANEMKKISNDIFGADFDGEFEGLYDAVLDVNYFKKMFSQAIDVANKYDVPLYCGEYGVIDRADVSSTLNWYKEIHQALEECNIARAAWTYKEMDFGITDKRLEEIREELIKLL